MSFIITFSAILIFILFALIGLEIVRLKRDRITDLKERVEKSENALSEQNEISEIKEKDSFDDYIWKEINSSESRNKANIIYTARTGNLIYEKAAHEIIDSVFKIAVDAVSHTLGIYGRNSLIMTIDNEYSWIYASKDGDENAKEIRYSDSIPANILDLIRGISNHMQAAVGDSTTSGYPIAYTLYKGLYEGIKKKKNTDKSISPAGIANILDEIENYLKANYFNVDESNMYQQIVEFGDRDLKTSVLTRVGSTSSNGNGKIAAKVAELFKNKDSEYDTFIQIDVSPLLGTEDEIVDEKGFELNHGSLSKQFHNQADGVTTVFQEPKFAVFTGPIMDDDKEILKKIITGVTFGTVDGVRIYNENECRPLVIIADGFSPSIEALALRMIRGNELAYYKTITDPITKVSKQTPVPFYAPLLLMRMDNKYEDNKELFQDLTTAIGAMPFDTLADKLTVNVDLTDKDIFEKVIRSNLGSAKKIIATPASCAILGGNGHESKITERINLLKKEYETYVSQSKLKPSTVQSNALRRRISMLKASVGKIIIGGINPKEKLTKRSVYDDVVRAIRTTIVNNGVALSGNVGLVHYIRHNSETIVNTITENLIINKMNVTIGNVESDIKELVALVLETVARSFETSYKKALFNAFSSNDNDVEALEKVDAIYAKCMEKEYPMVYNLSTGNYESFDDFDNCNLLVPRNTDKELVFAIFSLIKQLVTSEKIVTIAPLDVDLVKLREAFESGNTDRKSWIKN